MPTRADQQRPRLPTSLNLAIQTVLIRPINISGRGATPESAMPQIVWRERK